MGAGYEKWSETKSPALKVQGRAYGSRVLVLLVPPSQQGEVCKYSKSFGVPSQGIAILSAPTSWMLSMRNCTTNHLPFVAYRRCVSQEVAGDTQGRCQQPLATTGDLPVDGITRSRYAGTYQLPAMYSDPAFLDLHSCQLEEV